MAALPRADRRLALIARARLTKQCPWESQIEAQRLVTERRAETTQLSDQRSVGEHARRSSISSEWGGFLYSLVRQMHPETVLEMGTSVGISAAYWAAALHDEGWAGRLVTLEGDPVLAMVAKENFSDLGLSRHADVRVGRFEETMDEALRDLGQVDIAYIDGDHHEEPTMRYLEQVLPHMAPGGLILFDDIYWSDEMENAWRRLAADGRASFTVDLRKLGVWAPG